MNILIEIIGWIGSVCIVGAYFLNMRGKIEAQSLWYIWGNLIGGACFIVNTYFHQAYPSVVVNIVWVFIAIASLLKKK